MSRVAVVTGGASGMGEATCHELSRRGLKIAVLDVDERAAQRVTDDLRAEGGTAIGLGADVTDRLAVEHAFAKVRSELGAVTVLVTSAGLFDFSPFTDITVESWARIIDVNLTGTFHCCQVALPDMVDAKWGRIVMISSSSAQRGSPFAAHYAASKGGVITLTKSLAREYAPHGITVNNIPPSGIETPCSTGGKPPDIWAPTNRSPATFRWVFWGPELTSPQRSVSCVRTKPDSSRARYWVSMVER